MVIHRTGMTGKELDEIAEIWLTANLEAHSFINKDYWLSNYVAVKKQLGEAELFIATQGQTITGFLGISGTYIAGLFVDKRFRSRGIGRQLLDTAKRSRSKLSLSVYEKNKAAFHFYIHQGFIKTSTEIDGATGETVFNMEWQKANHRGHFK